MCQQLGGNVDVQHERPMRLDVSARFRGDAQLSIAFESELAPVGYMGRLDKRTWRDEFKKLCGIPAHLRVLSGYFMPGTGSDFESFLRQQVSDMANQFLQSTPGNWLLVFGSENSTKDPDQPWLPYSIGTNLQIISISHTSPSFCPRRIARGLDPAE